MLLIITLSLFTGYSSELWSLEPAKSSWSVCSVCAWHWKDWSVVCSHSLSASFLILYAAKAAQGQRAVLLITLNCTFGWMWPYLFDSSIFFWTCFTFLSFELLFRSSFQQWPLLLLCLLSPLALKSHCQACQSAQPRPPCPVSCRQVFMTRTVSHTQTWCIFSVLFLSDVCSVAPPPLQVCPQSRCFPPPPAPPSAPSLRWILQPPVSTPPPRYQVGDFSDVRAQNTACQQLCGLRFQHQTFERARGWLDLYMGVCTPSQNKEVCLNCFSQYLQVCLHSIYFLRTRLQPVLR